MLFAKPGFLQDLRVILWITYQTEVLDNCTTNTEIASVLALRVSRLLFVHDAPRIQEVTDGLLAQG